MMNNKSIPKDLDTLRYKDYLSKQYQELLNGLGVSYDRSIAYAGEQKGFVERHHRTVQDGLSQVMGYIGRNLSDRMVIEERRLRKIGVLLMSLGT